MVNASPAEQTAQPFSIPDLQEFHAALIVSGVRITDLSFVLRERPESVASIVRTARMQSSR